MIKLALNRMLMVLCVACITAIPLRKAHAGLPIPDIVDAIMRVVDEAQKVVNALQEVERKISYVVTMVEYGEERLNAISNIEWDQMIGDFVAGFTEGFLAGYGLNLADWNTVVLDAMGQVRIPFNWYAQDSCDPDMPVCGQDIFDLLQGKTTVKDLIEQVSNIPFTTEEVVKFLEDQFGVPDKTVATDFDILKIRRQHAQALLAATTKLAASATTLMERTMEDKETLKKYIEASAEDANKDMKNQYIALARLNALITSAILNKATQELNETELNFMLQLADTREVMSSEVCQEVLRSN